MEKTPLGELKDLEDQLFCKVEWKPSKKIKKITKKTVILPEAWEDPLEEYTVNLPREILFSAIS